MIKYLSQCHPVSLLLALLLWQGSAHAQAEGQSSQPIISSQIEELKAEVQQLRQLIEQQQSALKAMQKRMDEREVASDAGAARSVPPGNVRADTGTAAPRQSAASALNAQTPDQAGPPAGWNGNRFFIRSPDAHFQSDIIGYAQLDFHGYQSGNHPPNTFLIRRARLGVEGRLERYFDYKLEGDFSDTNNTLLRDLYG